MRLSHPHAPVFAGIALVLGAAPAIAGEVQIVDHPRLGGFAKIQDAVDAAEDGDVLLVGGGTYAGFEISGKSLWLIEAPGSTVRVLGTVTIENLAATQAVLLANLEILPVNGPGLILDQNAGHVRVQGSRIEGGSDPSGTGAGSPAVLANASQKVLFVACNVYGKDAPFLSGYPGEPGGHGIQAVDTGFALYDCFVEGGNGSEEGNPSGGDGGDGCNVGGWGIFASGSTLRGGRGGGGDYIGCNSGGNGGDALDITAAQARLLDNTLTAGSGGGGFCAPNGAPGLQVRENGALVDFLAGSRRKLAGPVLGGDRTRVVLTLTGQPGDLAWLLSWNAPGYGFVKAVSGVWALPAPLPIGFVALGPVPASGTLSVTLQPPDIGGASVVSALYVQAFCVEPGGKTTLTSPWHFALLDVLGAPDCNANAIIDYLDTTVLGGADCNENLVPDTCDPDCNGNGAPDACDIASGLAPDCNKNGVPDSCDLLAGTSLDCNGNAKPDECDIAAGTSMDANKNGVPDECEMFFVTYHVDAGAAPGGNGTPGLPFRSIGAALAVTVSGDRVLVRDGVYTGADNRDMDLAGRDVVVESVNGPAACVIDCENQGRAFVWSPPTSNAPCANPTVRGFTIRRGHHGISGGALFLHCGTLTNCVFELCNAGTGGAVFVRRRAVIEDCTFAQNVAYGGGSFLGPEGGSIYFFLDYSFSQDPPTIVRRCLFANNSAEIGGAVRLVRQANHVLSHNVFFDNTATLQGGALAMECRTQAAGLDVRLDDNLFAGNVAGLDGGAVFAKAPFGTTELRITGSTFTANRSLGGVGGGVAVIGMDALNSLTTTIENTLLWGNQAGSGGQLAAFKTGGASIPPKLTVAYCDVEGGQAGVHATGGLLIWGAGNIASNPLFADPDGPDNDPLTQADNDYRLGRFSPCVDAADTSAIPPDTSDIDGDGDTTEPVPLDLDLLARRADDPAVPDTGVGPAPVVDMGAYERRP
jgi:hypothetical protein